MAELVHPQSIKYYGNIRRKGLPLIVVAETDTWRKVRDMKGDESWVHRPALSGIRNVITTEETTIHKNPSVKQRPWR